MFRFALLLMWLLVCYISILIKAEPNIIIVQNVEDGTVTRVSFSIEARNGTNFSLICNVVDSKNVKHYDDAVMWSKRKRKLKFSNNDALNMLTENNIPDAKLSFVPVILSDQGTYVCISPKYKIFKVVEVIVRKPEVISSLSIKEASNSKNPLKRFKRSDDDYLRPESIHKFFFLMIGGAALFIIICAIIKCCHEDIDYTSNTRNRQWGVNNRQQHSNRYNQRVNSYRLARRRQCLHYVCNQNRNYHPNAGCMIFENRSNTDEEVIDSQSPLTVIVHDNDQNNVQLHYYDSDTVRIFDDSVILPNGDSSLPVTVQSSSDLPPTYANSTANSTASSMHSLHDTNDGFSSRILNTVTVESLSPPSYAEAVATSADANASSSAGGDDTTAAAGGGGGNEE